MINFFRKTRKKLADDNKFFKYSRYAIGEIVLVVIGILIALQINNWNEQNKTARQERAILIELVNNLDANIASLEASILSNSQAIRGIDIVLDHFENPSANDSLGQFLTKAYFRENLTLSSATFEKIKTIGLDIIRNDQVRISISELFEVDYTQHIKKH